MTLPELRGADARTLGALGERLRAIGYTASACAEIGAIGRAFLPSLRAPVQRWHLRARTDRAALAMRLLWFEESLPRQDAEAMFGGALVTDLLALGLVVASGGAISAPIHVLPIEDAYVLSDRDAALPGAVVVHPTDSARLARAARPRQRVARALDVPCGAGASTLLLARDADHVVAVDADARALALARASAAVSGRTNVEVRQGDLFGAVAGETFDRIVSRPPSWARPLSAEPLLHVHGGPCGDEVAMRVLGGVAAHLARGGRAVLRAQLPLFKTDRLLERIRAGCGTRDIRAVVLVEPYDVDEHCTLVALHRHRRIDAAATREVMEVRSHLSDLGIVGLCRATVVVERAEGRPSYVTLRRVARRTGAELTADLVDGVFATSDLLAGGKMALLDATLRFPEGTIFARTENEADVTVRLPPDRLLEEVTISPGTYTLMARVHAARTVRAGIGELARATALSGDVAIAKLLPIVAQGLRRGVLEIAR